jgi:hypothetical protein
MADDGGYENQLRVAMHVRYSVDCDANLPRAMLRKMPRRPLVEQLIHRKIRIIKLVSPKERDDFERQFPRDERIDWLACLETVTDINGFVIRLLDTQPLEEMILSVGHEVGHTHFVDLTSPHLERMARVDCRPPIDFEEAACDDFAALWVYRQKGTRNRAVLKHVLQSMLRAHPRKPWRIAP